MSKYVLHYGHGESLTIDSDFDAQAAMDTVQRGGSLVINYEDGTFWIPAHSVVSLRLFKDS